MFTTLQEVAEIRFSFRYVPCESVGGANWLQVDTTDIAGDQRQVVYQTLGPTFGLHLFDVNLALGNLVDLVRQQAAAFSG